MSKPSLPIIYSDAFIIVALVVIGLIAIGCLVLIPLFLLKKTPHKYPGYQFEPNTHDVVLNDEFKSLFSKVTIKNRYIVFTKAKAANKARIAICFYYKRHKEISYYDLDFSENETVRINFPEKAVYISYLLPVNEENRDSAGFLVESLKKSRLWLYAIATGVGVAVSIFLIVLILSTHLRKVNNGFIGFYFLAAIGLALIPGIYFLMKKIYQRGEKGGKE